MWKVLGIFGLLESDNDPAAITMSIMPVDIENTSSIASETPILRRQPVSWRLTYVCTVVCPPVLGQRRIRSWDTPRGAARCGASDQEGPDDASRGEHTLSVLCCLPSDCCNRGDAQNHAESCLRCLSSGASRSPQSCDTLCHIFFAVFRPVFYVDISYVGTSALLIVPKGKGWNEVFTNSTVDMVATRVGLYCKYNDENYSPWCCWSRMLFRRSHIHVRKFRVLSNGPLNSLSYSHIGVPRPGPILF